MAVSERDAQSGEVSGFDEVRHDWVLVDPQIKAKVGSIIVPDDAQKKGTSGVVVKVGKGKRTDFGYFRECTLAVGQRVIFPRHAKSHDVTVGEKRYYMIREEDILAVVATGLDVKVGTTDV